MDREEEEDDEPVTPAGRFFLQPEMQQIINCVVGLKNPVDVDAIKAEVENKLLKLHPRFSCILVRDKHGREHWRKTAHVDVDKHVIVIPEEEVADKTGGDDDDQDFVNNYVAGLTVSTPLDLSKPLWEVHLLPSYRCCVLRLHHALGDGISLMSFFLASCERADEPQLPPTMPGGKPAQAAASAMARIWMALLIVWYTLVYVVDMALHSLWVKDVKTPISGGAGVELWPRKLATASFSLADIKVVKSAADSTTVNDVILGVISYGLAKYLELPSLKNTSKPLKITGLAMVNTRKHSGSQDLSSLMGSSNKRKSRWGNQFGFVLLPICLEKDIKPLEYVERAKAMMNKKKLSLEAHFSYWGGAFVMSLLGPKVATSINYRIISNTSFTFSNVAGPLEEITFAKNPITYLRATSNGLPHALTMHIVSYKGKVDMQILVAKDIIHDSEVLAKCFQDALIEMKTIAVAKEEG